AEELGGEAKNVRPEAMDYLTSLDWPGNVRQLENTCRWLTVMAPAQLIHIDDLPPDLRSPAESGDPNQDWEQGLRDVARQYLAHGESAIYKDLGARFERILIEAALTHTSGRKQEAAQKLGLGRNTLTRKLKELGLLKGSR
ncbi:MAG: helix-turn-helix domain-containing protein, partial [Acidiferrobacterales bacterium]